MFLKSPQDVEYKVFFLIIFNSSHRSSGNPLQMHKHNIFHMSFAITVKANLGFGLLVHFQFTMMKGSVFGGKEFSYCYLLKVFAFCRFCKKGWQVWLCSGQKSGPWELVPRYSALSQVVTRYWWETSLGVWDHTGKQKVHSFSQRSLSPVLCVHFWRSSCCTLSIGLVNSTCRNRDHNWIHFH